MKAPARATVVNYSGGQTQSYTFDAMGNRATKTDSVNGNESYSYNAANMLLSRTVGATPQSYTNDANGNTLTGGGRTNTWDSQNRLVECTINGKTSQFTYGADGLRRRMTVTPTGGTPTTTDYTYDGQTMVQEGAITTNGDFIAKATYLQGPRGTECRIDETIHSTDSNIHDSAINTRWYLYDGLGSVLGEVDAQGNITGTRKHDVYGLSRGTSGTNTSKHGFVGSLGHSSDDETGMIYMRARYYDPSIGRFASEDPAHDGANWFVYCNSNPVNAVDPDGRIMFDDLEKLLTQYYMFVKMANQERTWAQEDHQRALRLWARAEQTEALDTPNAWALAQGIRTLGDAMEVRSGEHAASAVQLMTNAYNQVIAGVIDILESL